MEHIYSDAVLSWSWLDKYGELIEPDTKSKEELFKSISGQLEIVGLAPTNDEHLTLIPRLLLSCIIILKMKI